MDVEDAGVILLQVGKGVAAVSEVMTDVQTHAHAGITILNVVPDIFGIGVHGHIGAMQMNGQTDIVLTDFLLYIIQ